MINLNDVLLAMSNIPVGDPIVEIWGRGLQGSGYTVMEYTGELPITFNANGEALIDYRIYGNTEQTGTPTPENPIMPIGCGEKTENLIDVSMLTLGYTLDGTTGLPTVSQNRAATLIPIRISSSDAVISLSYSGEGTILIMYSVLNGNTLVRRTYSSNIPYLIDTSGGDTVYISLFTAEGYTVDLSKISNFMLVSGSTAPESYIPYEPYGYKLPILSNSTVTNIYLGESQTTRRIKKLVLTGDEYTWSNSYWANAYVLFGPLSDTRPTPVSDIGICSHFVQQSTNTPSSGHFNIRYTTNVVIGFGKSGFSTIDDFKSFLAAQYAAGTPVTVWYVLAEPETAVVNEPLMKIGDYADTVSMEQAGVSIPTNNGSTVIDYDGTPKPSQMYIKYLEVKND